VILLFAVELYRNQLLNLNWNSVWLTFSIGFGWTTGRSCLELGFVENLSLA